MDVDRRFYKRNLPHIQTEGATFFVTCSLKGSIPKNKLLETKEEYIRQKNTISQLKSAKQINLQKFFARRKYILNIDKLLHENKGPTFLALPQNAQILLDRIRSYDQRYYKLLAFTIMPNHFHILIDTSVQLIENIDSDSVHKDYVQLDKIMNLIKGGSARYINQRCKTEGRQVWEHESFDIYIRNEKMLGNVVHYILNNPIDADLVSSHEKHPYTFSIFN